MSLKRIEKGENCWGWKMGGEGEDMGEGGALGPGKRGVRDVLWCGGGLVGLNMFFFF